MPPVGFQCGGAASKAGNAESFPDALSSAPPCLLLSSHNPAMSHVSCGSDDWPASTSVSLSTQRLSTRL